MLRRIVQILQKSGPSVNLKYFKNASRACIVKCLNWSFYMSDENSKPKLLQPGAARKAANAIKKIRQEARDELSQFWNDVQENMVKYHWFDGTDSDEGGEDDVGGYSKRIQIPKLPEGYTPAIHEVLKKADSELKKPEVLKVPEVPVGHQFTLEEWQRSGTDFGTPKPTGRPESSCVHDWQIYHGFNSSDIWCTKCGQKRPFDPSR